LASRPAHGKVAKVRIAAPAAMPRRRRPAENATPAQAGRNCHAGAGRPTEGNPMKLLYAPGACSIGIHVLLEEIGKPYQAETVALREGAQYKPEYVAINPKSKVPTLVRDDGSAVTEFPAIAYYLAGSAPEKHLLPSDLEGQVRALEAVDYITSSVHMQGFTRIFRPTNFNPDESQSDSVKAAGLGIVDKGLGLLDKQLGSREFVTGSFSIADAALFYVEFWYADRMKKQLPANLARHWAMMSARPAVKAVLVAEGLAA
jgi:glutathione S-transferase